MNKVSRAGLLALCALVPTIASCSESDNDSAVDATTVVSESATEGTTQIVDDTTQVVDDSDGRYDEIEPVTDLDAGADTFQVKQGLVPDGESASDAGGEGAPPPYEQTGELVADSGFRPTTHGFAFENYGNEAEPTNMTPPNVANLFGNQVCLTGSVEDGDCALVPAAQKWMEGANAAMAGGHCEGFSIAALRIYAEELSAADFGAETTVELEIIDNDALQAVIAESFIYQAIPTILENQVKGTPTEVLDALVAALNSGEEHYTLGIYKRDFTGGHAITPFAVEDQGDGVYAILVYDNNFPGEVRAVTVDTNSDTWSYVGGPNPNDANQVYEGDATTNTMELDPESQGRDYFPCPFCTKGSAGGGAGFSGGALASPPVDGEDGFTREGEESILPEDQRYTEITLIGDPGNHPHLVFQDEAGNQTGIVDGRLLQEVEGVEVVKQYAVQNWVAAPEPRFRIAEGADVTILLDGSALEGPASPTIDLVSSNGLFVEITDIEMQPGQQDLINVIDGNGLNYVVGSDEAAAPSLAAGVLDDDEAFVVAFASVGALGAGAIVSLAVDVESKAVILSATGPGGEGAPSADVTFAINFSKSTADGSEGTWATEEIDFSQSPATLPYAAFLYDETTEIGAPIELFYLDDEFEPVASVQVDPE